MENHPMPNTGIDPKNYSPRRAFLDAIIPTGATTSGSVYIGGLHVVSVWRPASSGLTSLTFEVSSDDVTWFAAEDQALNAITVTLNASAGASHLSNIMSLSGADYIRIKGNAAVSGGNKTFKLIALAV
jgi:hypothetical protein